MAPTPCYLEVYEAIRDSDHKTAHQRALALEEWLDRGGFYPPRYTQVEVDSYLRNGLRRTAYPG